MRFSDYYIFLRTFSKSLGAGIPNAFAIWTNTETEIFLPFRSIVCRYLPCKSHNSENCSMVNPLAVLCFFISDAKAERSLAFGL